MPIKPKYAAGIELVFAPHEHEVVRKPLAPFRRPRGYRKRVWDVDCTGIARRLNRVGLLVRNHERPVKCSVEIQLDPLENILLLKVLDRFRGGARV